MAKKKPFLPFEEARQYIKDQCLPSKKGFEDWWKANKPKTIPHFPYRVYIAEWKGWNDFLGNNNKMNLARRNWRPINEATVWVHKLAFSNEAEWLKYCSENRKTMPVDIPSRPDIVYKEWLSWNHWLGNKPRQKVEAQVAAQSNVIYYIIHEVGNPANVYTVGIMHGGMSALKDKWQREKFTVVRTFKYNPICEGIIDYHINRLSTSWYGDKYVRVVPNINELIWSFFNVLEPAT